MEEVDHNPSLMGIGLSWSEEEILFSKESNVKMLRKLLVSLKRRSYMESHKMTFLYFIVGGLNLLGEFGDNDREQCINFVISNAVIENKKIKGFRGGNFTGLSNNTEYLKSNVYNIEDKPHIAATYSALSILKMCGCDLVDKDFINSKIQNFYNDSDISLSNEALLNEIMLSQNAKGQISAQTFDTENDVRFLYCALCIHKYLGMNSVEQISKTLDIDLSLKYCSSISNYEGGFSMLEDGESNAGLTYCAVASYKMLGMIDKIPNRDWLIRWLVNRASNELGVNGRPNKLPDSCYSFWVMGSLSILEGLGLIEKDHVISFIMSCQTLSGGFSKFINFDKTEEPDLLHTFYALAGLSILEYEGIVPLDTVLAIPIGN